jgi:hypothetical protein
MNLVGQLFVGVCAICSSITEQLHHAIRPGDDQVQPEAYIQGKSYKRVTASRHLPLPSH